MAGKEKSKLRQMIDEYGIKDMNDVHEFVKMLTAETIQAALDAELENDLGYSKYDYKNKKTTNSRNGYSPKTVQSSEGEMEIQIPRDRNGEFEPQLVKKHQTDISAIEDKVIFLYSQGISTRDIQKTMQEMYGIDVDDSRVSKITDKILPLIKEWQERPLQSIYAMVILDAVHYNVRENGIVKTNYMESAMFLLGIIDKKMKHITPENINRYTKICSDEGFKEIKQKVFDQSSKGPLTKVIVLTEYVPSLIAFLRRVFVEHGGPYDLDKGVEPPYLNRNWLMHGHMTRDVEKYENIQLFNALDTLNSVTEELKNEQTTY